MQRMTALFSAALLATGLMAGTAHAQQADGQAQDPMATQQAPTQDFSDQQLQQFADASQEIAVISQEYTQRLQEAEDEATQQEVRAEANDRMIEVVEGGGHGVPGLQGRGFEPWGGGGEASRDERRDQPGRQQRCEDRTNGHRVLRGCSKARRSPGRYESRAIARRLEDGSEERTTSALAEARPARARTVNDSSQCNRYHAYAVE